MKTGDRIIQWGNCAFNTFESMRRWLGFPRVETISTSELKTIMAGGDSSLVLVDVRSASERAVSRIPGAISRQEFEANPTHSLHHQIVVYCTAGGRSYMYTRKLVSKGIQAKNYRDGILGWCRAMMPLETPDGRPTNAVHLHWKLDPIPNMYEVKNGRLPKQVRR